MVPPDAGHHPREAEDQDPLPGQVDHDDRLPRLTAPAWPSVPPVVPVAPRVTPITQMSNTIMDRTKRAWPLH